MSDETLQIPPVPATADTRLRYHEQLRKLLTQFAATKTALANEITRIETEIANLTASDISYDNATSGLVADDVQEALDEIEGLFDDMQITYKDGVQLDAFGRLRVSNPLAIFDSKLLYDKNALEWDESLESGSGITSTHSDDEAAVTLANTANTAGLFTRRTFMPFGYQPGKSQLILQTAVLRPLSRTTGLRRRVGLFNDDNGLFFYDDAGTMKVVRRSNVSGTPEDTEITQANWNIDPMDGTGPSGYTADWSKTQIFVTDFEWLGVGRVRMGLNIDGQTWPVHQFLNANNLSDVYMSTPNLPLTYQFQSAPTSDAGEMKCICSAVISEGGADETGRIRTVGTGDTTVSANADGTIYPVVAMRAQSDKLGTIIQPTGVELMETVGSKYLEWKLLLNPTLSGAYTWTDLADSNIEYATFVGTQTVTSEGTEIAGGFFTSAQKGGGSVQTKPAGSIRPGVAIDGTVDILVLAVRPIDCTNTNVYGKLFFRESP